MEPAETAAARLGLVQYLLSEHERVTGRIGAELSRFSSGLEERGLVPDDEALGAASRFLSQLDRYGRELREFADGLATPAESSAALYRSFLSTYRCALIARSGLVRTLSWGSTGYDQSLVPYFFFQDTTGYSTNRFNYDRAGGYRQEELGPIYARALGFDESISPLVTGSCMSALSLIERHILSRATEFPIRVLAPRKIYFETSFAFFANPRLFEVHVRDVHEPTGVLEAVREVRPHVLFMETLQNFHGLRLLDTESVLRGLAGPPVEPLQFVILDESALPGLYDPFAVAAPGSTPFDLLYVTSCSKYLQLGFDVIPLGLLVCRPELRAELRRVGAAGGFLAPETSVWMVPEISRACLSGQLLRSSRCAVAFARELERATAQSALSVAYPALADHPSANQAARIPYAGGLVTCSSSRCSGDSADLVGSRYHKVVRGVLRSAGEIGIALGDSEGFGFNDPRIHLCKWPSEEPFIRFTFGELGTSQIEELARVCAAEFRAEGLL